MDTAPKETTIETTTITELDNEIVETTETTETTTITERDNKIVERTETTTTNTTFDDPVSTENVTTPAPADRFLTLASNNTRAMSFYVSEVKNAYNEFTTGVCTLVEDEEDYEDTDSDSELYKKIVANEFEPIIASLKNMIQSLEQRYLAAKDVFNYRMSKEMANFENPYPTIATGM